MTKFSRFWISCLFFFPPGGGGWVLNCFWLVMEWIKACFLFSIRKQKPDIDNAERYKKVAVAATDTLIWQGLASVAIPGFTINRICWLSRLAVSQARSIPPVAQKWSVVAIGLGSIPFIIRPIDRGVDLMMDSTLRRLPFWGHWPTFMLIKNFLLLCLHRMLV